MMKVSVTTSNGGGHSPDDVAEMCVSRLINISDTAPPELAVQARACRQQMLDVVSLYVKMAIREDRRTVKTQLEQAGQSELARYIEGL